MSDASEPRANPVVRWMLVLLPLWLVVSSLIGLGIWWRGERAGEGEEPVKFTTPVSARNLAGDLDKLQRFAPQRQVTSDAGRSGLSRASAMIQGSLGPGNAGYRVELWASGSSAQGEWPIVVASLPGDDREPLWVLAGYDTAPQHPIEANTSGVVALLGVAGEVAGQALGRPVKFAFLPHLYDPEAPVLETLGAFLDRAAPQTPILVVEAMGGGLPLVLSSRDQTVLDDPAVQGGGEVVGGEVLCLLEDSDPALLLADLGHSALRVATRVSAEEPGRLPEPAGLAEATTKLGALLRALAR